eukprot:1159986-Pyramimonas_sp.AAC.1
MGRATEKLRASLERPVQPTDKRKQTKTNKTKHLASRGAGQSDRKAAGEPEATSATDGQAKTNKKQTKPRNGASRGAERPKSGGCAQGD